MRKAPNASRGSETAEKQKEAFEATRELAKKAGSEVAIHGGDNKNLSKT